MQNCLLLCSTEVFSVAHLFWKHDVFSFISQSSTFAHCPKSGCLSASECLLFIVHMFIFFKFFFQTAWTFQAIWGFRPFMLFIRLLLQPFVPVPIPTPVTRHYLFVVACNRSLHGPLHIVLYIYSCVLLIYNRPNPAPSDECFFFRMIDRWLTETKPLPRESPQLRTQKSVCRRQRKKIAICLHIWPVFVDSKVADPPSSPWLIGFQEGLRGLRVF